MNVVGEGERNVRHDPQVLTWATDEGKCHHLTEYSREKMMGVGGRENELNNSVSDS